MCWVRVVSFLESTYNVKIVTKQPKPRPPDSELLKWLSCSMSRGPEAARGTHKLNSEMKGHMVIPKPPVDMSKLLAQLEEYRK